MLQLCHYIIAQEDVYSTTEDMVDMRRRASLEYGGAGESVSMTYGTLHRMDGDNQNHHQHQQQIYAPGSTPGHQSNDEQYAGMITGL